MKKNRILSTIKEFCYNLTVSFSPDGKTLASGSSDKTIKIFDVKEGTRVKSLKGHDSSVYSLSFSPDGKTLASLGYLHEKIKFWDLKQGSCVENFIKENPDCVYSVSFSPDGKTLAAGTNSKKIKILDIKEGIYALKRLLATTHLFLLFLFLQMEKL